MRLAKKLAAGAMLVATVAAAALVFRLLVLGFLIVDAVEHRDLRTITVLIRKGASVNAQGKDGSTPLILAANPPQPDLMRWLLRRGANPDVRNDYGFTPLGWAAMDHDLPAMRILLAAGAPPNRRFLRSTPLEYAATTGDVEATRVLLEHGADVNFPDSDGRSPLAAVRVAHLAAPTRALITHQLVARGARE